MRKKLFFNTNYLLTGLDFTIFYSKVPNGRIPNLDLSLKL